MNIIAFSDLHSELHDDFSYQLPNGMNSRLVDCLDVLDKVAYYRDKYDCKLVINAGDTFHTPQVMSTVVFQETYKRLEKLASGSKQFITLAGNHDMASITRDGVPVSTIYALSNLKSTTLAVGRYEAVKVDDIEIHSLPYIKDRIQLEKQVELIAKSISKSDAWKNIIVTHIGLDQATNGPNEIKLKNSYALSKLRKLGADHILSGHHHHPQGNGHWSVIGSPLQMNMSDRGDRRGLLIYNTHKDTVKRIWLRGSRFFMVNIERFKDYESLQRLADKGEYNGGYVRVMLTHGVVPDTKIVDVLQTHAKMYKILPVNPIQNTTRSEAVTQKAVANIGNMRAVVKDYVEHLNPTNLKHKRLISIGRKLVP